MLKIKSSTSLTPSRANTTSYDTSEKGPVIIDCRSLRPSETTPSSSTKPNSKNVCNADNEFSQDKGTLELEYNPVDLSVACSRMGPRSTSGSQIAANKTMSLLPQIWHLCDLCDGSFSSKFSLMEHVRRIHRTRRMPKRDASPEVEIIPIRLPNNVLPNQKSHNSGNNIVYHPPEVTIRRMSSSSSGSSNQSNQDRFVNSQQPHSSILFTQFELLSEVCRVCSARFSDKRSLMSHMKVSHPMESRFGCSICSKVLSSRAALIGHMRIHTGEKPHVCNICNRAFSNSQTLTRHFRTHTKEKPFSCPICGKRASLRHNMKLHIKIHEKQMVLVGVVGQD